MASEAQTEFEAEFQKAIGKRDAAIRQLSDATASVPRLKAEVAQARADVAKLRADARAAGVKLPKTAKSAVSNGHSLGAAVPYATSDESEDGED